MNQAGKKNSTPLRWLRLTGVAGVIGAIMWILGDVLLIGATASVADYPLVLDTYADRVDTEKAAMMLPSSETRLAAGVLVANVSVVFYLAGTWHLFRGLLPAGRWWAWPLFVLLLCGFAWTPLGHAAYYYIGMVYKTLLTTPSGAHEAILALGERFHEVLVIAWTLPIVTIGLALLGLGVRIALGGTAWPRWFVLVANPVSLLAIGTAIASVSPEPVATWLSGAAFNLGLLVIYVLSTMLLWNGGHRPPTHSTPSVLSR
ncbi:DUF6796 family protein [Nocardiopsis sp. NPDC006139]|uniref:DUF6796 family protein n=1 Tax=Nocardiopsis sp. NPDC006139 TaxID=3154578 RepID=UPI0033BB1ECA